MWAGAEGSRPFLPSDCEERRKGRQQELLSRHATADSIEPNLTCISSPSSPFPHPASSPHRFHRFHRFYCFLHVDSHSIQNINPSAYTLVRARTLTIPLQCMECTHLGHCTCCAVNFPPSLPVAKQLPKSVVFKPVLESKHRQFQEYTST